MRSFSRRELGRLGLIGGISACLGGTRAAAKTLEPAAILLANVDPEMRAGAMKILAGAKGPSLDRNYLNIRSSIQKSAQAPRADIAVEKRVIPVPGGSRDVTIFVINAKAGAARPAILHTHGGGVRIRQCSR